MKRILIIGNSGAGKTTLARKLSKILQLEIIHLDQHYWLPNWTQPAKNTWKKKVKELTEKETWIMDGNYTSSIPIRLERTDTVILLKRSRWICLWNIFTRWIKYRGQTRPESSPNCPERLDWAFLKFIFSYNKQYLPRVEKALAQKPTHTKLIILHTKKEIQNFLTTLKAEYR